MIDITPPAKGFTTSYLDRIKKLALQGEIPAGKKILEGSARTGFGVQVSTKRLSFVYVYRVKGDKARRKRVMTLGEYGQSNRAGDAGKMTLSQAGEIHAKWLRVRNEGLDPQAVRDDELLSQKREIDARLEKERIARSRGTIKQLFHVYVESMREKGKRSADNVEYVLTKNVFPIVPPDTKAKDFTQADTMRVLAAIIDRDAHRLANLTRSYLSAAFTFGITWDCDPKREHDEIRFAIKTNPVQSVKRQSKGDKARNRALSLDELRRFWLLLDQANIKADTKCALKLLYALGGQRVEEVLKIHTDHVDLKNHTVLFPKTKNGKPHLVPFGSVAHGLLSDLVAEGGDGFIFARHRYGKPRLNTDGSIMVMSSMTLSQAIRRICDANDLERFQPRDARRTVKTLLGAAGVSKEIRDRYQNHALTDVSSKHYDLHDYLAEKRHAATAWNEVLLSAIVEEGSQKVVKLHLPSQQLI